jgi:hypothetical protein
LNNTESYELDGSKVIDSERGVRLRSYSGSAISSIGDNVNTTSKASGKMVWDASNYRVMVASGSGASDPWYIADGSGSVTPS